MIGYKTELTAEQLKAKKARTQTRKWVEEYEAAFENATRPLVCKTAYGRLKAPKANHNRIW